MRERWIGLQLLKRDSFGLRLVNLQTTSGVKLQRVNTRREPVDPAYISDGIREKFSHLPLRYQVGLTQILENEGCVMSGHIEIYKVSRESFPFRSPPGLSNSSCR